MTTASDKLMAAKPSKVDQSLEASLPAPIASCLKPRAIDRSTAEHGFDDEFQGYDVIAMPDESERGALEQAIRQHEACCLPAPEEALVMELSALRALTKARAEDAEDMDFQTRIYARRLQDYPADIVLEVLRTQPNMCKWWPAWEELNERLEWRARKRTKRLEAMRGLLEKIENYG